MFSKPSSSCDSDKEAHLAPVYRNLVQSVTDYAIYMLDLDGIVTTWNAGAQRAKGYAAHEITGRHYGCFYSQEDRLAGVPMQNLEIARRNGKFEDYGWRLRKDGSRLWAHVVIDPIYDEGKLYGYAKITRDCTEQREQEHAAHEHERQFRYLVQSVTDYAIYMLDVEGIVSNWNIGAERTKGYIASEIVGQHFGVFYTPEDLALGTPQMALATALEHGTYEAEGWRVRKDGSQFWAHVIIDPVYDDSGALYGFAKITRDRTEAHRTQQATIDQERSFRLLVEGVTDYAIYMLDLDGIVTNWNAGAQRAKGYTAEEIVGRHFSAFYEADDRAKGLPAEGLETARRTGRFEAEGWRLRKDGSRFWAHVVIQPIHDDDGKLFGFAKITRDRTERREAEQRIEFLAHHDTLTGLPNRETFRSTLQTLLSDPKAVAQCAVLYLDLDRFKAVNDTHGHAAGDELIRAVTKRLAHSLGPQDLLARLSGDEFAIIQRHCENQQDVEVLAQDCIDSLSSPFSLAGNEVSIGVSIGIMIHPRLNSDASVVIQQADFALYNAKRNGRNCYHIYEHSMRDPLKMRNELEDDLRMAMEAGQLSLAYQPIYDAASGKMTACEALLRWEHPQRGLISPAEFIPLAEERGLMFELGAWVIQRACEDARNWPSTIRLCVNVSAAQLLSNDFLSLLVRVLRQSTFPANRLELEITETTLLEFSETPRRQLTAIRALGVGISMDDFGTGYSSLGVLQSFPFSRIKIDRSFVFGIEDSEKSRAIVRAIAGLCANLALPVVAEGVETAEQRAFLTAEHCTELQGFLFSQPLPPTELQALMGLPPLH